jgi:hypothetical protein
MDLMAHTLRPILNASAHTIYPSGRVCVKKVATNRLLAAESDVETKNGSTEPLPHHDLKFLVQRVRSVALADLLSVEIKSKSRTSLPMMMMQRSLDPKALRPLFHLNLFQSRRKVRT